MPELIADNATQRAAVDESMERLLEAAENLDASSSDTFTAAVQTVMDDLLAGIADPGMPSHCWGRW